METTAYAAGANVTPVADSRHYHRSVCEVMQPQFDEYRPVTAIAARCPGALDRARALACRLESFWQLLAERRAAVPELNREPLAATTAPG